MWKNAWVSVDQREREKERAEAGKKTCFRGFNVHDGWRDRRDPSIHPLRRRARFRQLKLFIKRLPVESKHVERERGREGGGKSKGSWKNGR